MRCLTFVIVLLISFNMYSQIKSTYKDIFIRIYNIEGKKIAKGKVLDITEKSITLFRKNKQIKIHLYDIGKIRIKRSFGNNALKGAAIGGISLAILGAVSAPNDSSFLSYTPQEGALVGTVLGGFLGTAIGAFTGLFKNSKVYIVNGDLIKFNFFKSLVLVNKE